MKKGQKYNLPVSKCVRNSTNVLVKGDCTLETHHVTSSVVLTTTLTMQINVLQYQSLETLKTHPAIGSFPTGIFDYLPTFSPLRRFSMHFPSNFFLSRCTPAIVIIHDDAGFHLLIVHALADGHRQFCFFRTMPNLIDQHRLSS